MAIETIIKQVNEDAGTNGKSLEQTVKDACATCYTEPKVPEEEFLKVVQKYDPNFKPISDADERKRRAALTKEAREKVQAYVLHHGTSDALGVKVPEGKRIARHHYILLRGKSLEEKQKLVDILLGGDKRAVGDLIYGFLTARKEELYALREKSDEELLKTFFEHKDTIDLIAELQKVIPECEFATPEQEKLVNEMRDQMASFAGLANHIDLIASPYYAKFPCEKLNMKPENSALLRAELGGLSTAYGEKRDKHTEGPAADLGFAWSGVGIFRIQLRDWKIEKMVEEVGGDLETCIWADAFGNLKTRDDAGEELSEHKPIVVNIPGKGIKVLMIDSQNPMEGQPYEATGKDLQQYMERANDLARTALDKANPFFISKFTGSKQFDAMSAKQKEVDDLVKNLEHPLKDHPESAEKTMRAIAELGKACMEYLEYKKGQGLEIDKKNGLPIGRSENERNRIASAQKAMETFELLNFQFTCQVDPASAARALEQGKRRQDAQKAAEKAAKEKAEQEKAKKEAERKAQAEEKVLQEEDRCKSTPEEMKAFAEAYGEMPACKPSNAGDALPRMQNELKTLVGRMAMYGYKNEPIGENTQSTFLETMAKMVLFNYVLKERVANGQTGDNIEAGPVETSLVKFKYGSTVAKLKDSAEFKEVIGKITPARIEKFLKDSEAKSKDFEKIVRGALFQTKEIAPAKQADQPQAQAQKEKEVSKGNGIVK